jgi:hypothetical protein
MCLEEINNMLLHIKDATGGENVPKSHSDVSIVRFVSYRWYVFYPKQ